MSGSKKKSLSPEEIARQELERQRVVTERDALQKLNLLQEAQRKSAVANTAAINTRNSKEGTSAVGRGIINVTNAAVTGSGQSLGSNNILGV